MQRYLGGTALEVERPGYSAEMWRPVATFFPDPLAIPDSMRYAQWAGADARARKEYNMHESLALSIWTALF
ncbi:MAG: hypothetical protein L7S64_12840, partial [Longimicrobiales bacterium]|nr:hypothetical protein [Longimicrobiales bacterium]